MIEKIVLDYLLSEFDEVYLERPVEKPSGRYIIFEKTSGSLNEHIKRATIAVQSYGNSLLDACTFNEQVKEHMLNIAELDSIYKISLNSDYNFTKTNTKDYRYQAVFEIVYY